MKLLLLASAGGAIGAGLRYLVNQTFSGPAVTGGMLVFPWATIVVNVLGGFLMGALFVYLNERLGNAPEWRVFLGTGILGGLTTFSAYSLDMMNLLVDNGLSTRFLAYTIGSVVLAFAALAAGMALTRTILS